MAGRPRGKGSSSNDSQDRNSDSIMDSEFILLDDLVYAPLHSYSKLYTLILRFANISQNGEKLIICNIF